MKKVLLSGLLMTSALSLALGQVATNATTGANASKNDAYTETFARCRGAVCVVEGSESVGTGFVCQFGEKKYLVTNRHVAWQTGTLTAKFEDGTKFRFDKDSAMEVALNRDLVRFGVVTQLPALKVCENLPKIGDGIEFYGNARGGKVVTVSAGKIMACGMERIEIDTPIQAGNSGSPVVTAGAGEVLGVTTLSEMNRASKDQSTWGTRYDPLVKATREFAVRFTDVQWQKLKYGSFVNMVGVQKDVISLLYLIDKACFGSLEMIGSYEFAKIRLPYARSVRDALSRVSAADDKVKKSREQYERMILKSRKARAQDPKKGRMIGSYSKLDFDGVIKSISRATCDAYKARSKFLGTVGSIVSGMTWFNEELKTVAVEYMNDMKLKFDEDYKFQLEGLDLPGIPSNPFR